MSQQIKLTLSSPKRRPRKNSAEFLDNKQFAYLLDNNEESPNPKTPINGKQDLKEPRTPSVQIETTKTQNEQLEAIKKEVEYLESSVPHFSDLYSATQLQWASIKRKNKAESSAFSLIQTLSEWIHLYGMKAVKEYDEFKQSAEREILSMVDKMEKSNHEITKLNLLYEEAENEKVEALNNLNEVERENIKYKKERNELNEDKQSKELNKNTINDLENELDALSIEYKTLKDKYERVEKYWKMTQTENDELRNKNYAIEEETNKLKTELKHNRESINNMNLKHEKVLTNLQIEHQSYALQMEEEQEKLIAAQQTANKNAQNTTMTPTGSYTIDADINDADMVRQERGMTLDVEEMDASAIVSLENEINLYQYEDDEWLNDTDSDLDLVEEDLEEPVPEPVVIEEYNKQSEFEIEKISNYHDIIYEDIPKGYKTSKIPKEEKEFENESIKIEVKSKRKSLDLMMSQTQISHTPPSNSVDAGFESVSTGIMQRKNKIETIPETKVVTKRIIIERGPKQEESVVKPGKNFSERLAMFRHLDETRGGKPQILSHMKGYSLVNKWKTQNKNKVSVIHGINANSNNVHITKSTRGQSINVVKITKKKVHTLNPRLFGYMNIIRSSFIPQWKLTKQQRYFFVLDGLPSQTNVNKNEPDFAKNRKHDFLVPTLFFFVNKDEYDIFFAKIKNIATRSVEFQRAFASYAKGTFALNNYAMDTNIVNCMKRVNKLLKKSNVRLPIEEINGCGDVDNWTILLCNDEKLHRFACNDTISRNRWIKKVNKLVDKRSRRLSNINQGLMNAYDEKGNRITDADTLDSPGGIDTPPTTIGDFELTSPYNAIDNKD